MVIGFKIKKGKKFLIALLNNFSSLSANFHINYIIWLHSIHGCKVYNYPKLAKGQIKTLHMLKIILPSDFFVECWNPLVFIQLMDNQIIEVLSMQLAS